MDPMQRRLLVLALATVLALTAAVPAFAEGAAPVAPGCTTAIAATSGNPAAATGTAAVAAHCPH
jgi:hypothetical protein